MDKKTDFYTYAVENHTCLHSKSGPYAENREKQNEREHAFGWRQISLRSGIFEVENEKVRGITYFVGGGENHHEKKCSANKLVKETRDYGYKGSISSAKKVHLEGGKVA